jgi:hypothetical protein
MTFYDVDYLGTDDVLPVVILIKYLHAVEVNSHCLSTVMKGDSDGGGFQYLFPPPKVYRYAII